MFIYHTAPVSLPYPLALIRKVMFIYHTAPVSLPYPLALIRKAMSF
jgi:hypothetical protein